MKPDRIEQLLRELPASSLLYLATGPRGAASATPQEVLEERLSRAIYEPCFAWAYVTEFARQHLPLPTIVTEKYMEWAYQHMTGQMVHPDIMSALMFCRHGWEDKRGCLNAVLIDSTWSLRRIAKYFSQSLNTILLYERLFFPIRDRWDDGLYFASLAHPFTRLVEQNPEYVKHASAPTVMMMQSAAGYGAEAAILIMGGPKQGTSTEDELIDRMRKNVFIAADEAIKTGGLRHSNSPAIRHAMNITLAREQNPNVARETTDSEVGLGALNMTPGEAIEYTMNGLLNNSDYEAQVRADTFEEVSLEALRSANGPK